MMKDNNLKISKTLGQVLKQKELTIAAGESCTGGALLTALTDIPGSSAYVIGGTVAYSNKTKIKQLKVIKDDINCCGAVSKTVALQMAKNVAKIMNTDIGLSTTGIAGPGGGTDKKPVGTVWFGFWYDQKHVAGKANFSGDRLAIKRQTVKSALQAAINLIHNEPLPEHLHVHQSD